MLRTHLYGASAAQIAVETGLSPAHTRRCLRDLEARGFVERRDTTVMWGYAPRRVRLWTLRMGEQTLAALPLLAWRPPPQEPKPSEHVPEEFWYLFWSGDSAAELKLPEDSIHIADTLIGGPDRAAQAWALTNLPLKALQELRSMRGYGVGTIASWLDFTINERSNAAD